jgi:hypothetical protein
MDPIIPLLLLAGLGVAAVLKARLSTARASSGAITVPRGSGAPAPRGPIPAFPESIPARDAFILEAVKGGKAEIRWATLRSTYKNHTAEFRVFADALKIGGVRVNLTAIGQQHVADALGCMLLTLQLADLIWSQRQVELKPVEMSATQHDLDVMGTVERMVLHSQKIDDMIALLPKPPEGIVCTVGKHWVISDVLAKPTALQKHLAMNYGWHNRSDGPKCATASGIAQPGGPPCHVVQDPGTWHNVGHSDYSQTCVLVHGQCMVDGQPTQVSKLLQDPELAFLASATGRMNVLRQPGS